MRVLGFLRVEAFDEPVRVVLEVVRVLVWWAGGLVVFSSWPFGCSADPVAPCGIPVRFAAFGPGRGLPVVDEFAVFVFEVDVWALLAHLVDDALRRHPVVFESGSPVGALRGFGFGVVDWHEFRCRGFPGWFLARVRARARFPPWGD